MLKMKWLRKGIVFFAVFFLFGSVIEMNAFARMGGGRSFGSRGSRTYMSPSQPTMPSQAPSSPYNYNQPQRSFGTSGGGFWHGMAGGIAGGLLGGMLFRSLGFAGGGFGMGGGIGLMDIVLIGLLLYGIYWFLKRRRSQTISPSAYRESGVEPGSPGYASSPYTQPGTGNDVNRGIDYIRQMDPSFNEKLFLDTCMDLFFQIQGAWMNRDISAIRNLFTEEMYRLLTLDVEKLKADKQINRLENIAVRSVDIAEAWQEGGRDFITVRFYANLLDYTTDEAGQVLTGSKTDPVKFEEYWTFTRPVGAPAWQLSAVTQAQ